MLPKIKKILYATDLSPNSGYAFRYAMGLANEYNSEISILNIFEELPSITLAIAGGQEFGDYENKIVKKAIRERINRINKGIKGLCEMEYQDVPGCYDRITSVDVYEGYPAEEILKKADELGCDIIVMGSHGKGVLEYTFLGSTAQKVLRRAKKPFFIVPLPSCDTDNAYNI